jgi:hypothetical protein
MAHSLPAHPSQQVLLNMARQLHGRSSCCWAVWHCSPYPCLAAFCCIVPFCSSLFLLSELLGAVLPPSGRLLDLCASWDSHLPPLTDPEQGGSSSSSSGSSGSSSSHLAPEQEPEASATSSGTTSSGWRWEVVGVGLNQKELAANKALNSWLVQVCVGGGGRRVGGGQGGRPGSCSAWAALGCMPEGGGEGEGRRGSSREGHVRGAAAREGTGAKNRTHRYKECWSS